MFPIRQKFNSTAAFSDNINVQILSILEIVADIVQLTLNTGKKYPKFAQIETFGLSKKDAGY